MATDVGKLKALKSKGAPPALDAVPDVIESNGRPEKAEMEAMLPIQFRVPKSVFEDFSRQAGEEFGFSKGSKSSLFLKLWDAYRKSA